MVDILSSQQVKENRSTKRATNVDRNSGKLPRIFGLPPWNLEGRTNEIMLNSMPVAEIIPSIPSFQRGLDLFRLVPAWDQYSRLLKNHGFEFEQGVTNLKVAFLADNFPTDTFQNEYGENFLQKFTAGVSEGAASLAQIMGVKSGTEALKRIQKSLEKGGTTGKIVGGMMGKVGDVAESVLNAIPGGGAVRGGISIASRLAAGARIDFPQVWKTSSYAPSYTMTIRLYNPDPRSDESTQKYIVGPIAALALLGVPLSEDGGTYNWPFLHKIRATGVYNLDPAYIGSITIVKGGDQQSISYNQRLGIVDVRIDFGSLYSTLIAGNNINPGRPTLKKYLDAISGKRSVSNRLGDLKLDKSGTSTTVKVPPTVEEIPAGEGVPPRNNSDDVDKANKLSARQQQLGI
ncbi:MAG: hypothetical protein PVG65_00425 [Candidatus Thorarchaeota archaeon]|jgi:hypothetical protein